MIATSASGAAATAATPATAAGGYEPWPPIVGAALDETELTGVVVVAFTFTDPHTHPHMDGHCVLVRDPHRYGNAWTLPAARLERGDATRTWQEAARRALAEAGLRTCDITPFGVVRDHGTGTVRVVAWAECAGTATNTNTSTSTNVLPVGEAAHLLATTSPAATSPLESQLCRLAARLRRNSCHRPTTTTTW